MNCVELQDKTVLDARKAAWDAEVDKNGGTHPSIGDVDTRLLNRMRRSAVSAIFGAGMHPDRKVWVCEPREGLKTQFTPSNKYRT